MPVCDASSPSRSSGTVASTMVPLLCNSVAKAGSGVSSFSTLIIMGRYIACLSRSFFCDMAYGMAFPVKPFIVDMNLAVGFTDAVLPAADAGGKRKSSAVAEINILQTRSIAVQVSLKYDMVSVGRIETFMVYGISQR